MLKLLAKAKKPVETTLKDHFSKIAKEAYDPRAKEAISATFKKHGDPYKTDSTPGEFVETLLFKGRRDTRKIGPTGGRQQGHFEQNRRAKENYEYSLSEGPRGTAERIFGSALDDMLPAEEAAARAALGKARSTAASNIEGTTAVEKTTRETFENLKSAPLPYRRGKPGSRKRKTWDRKAERLKSAETNWLGAQDAMLNAQKAGPTSVGAAEASYKEARAKSGAVITKAVEDFDATRGGRPFMGIPSWIINHPKTIMGAVAIPYIANVADSTAGYAIGGPGYGGAVGWGEGQLGGRNNIFQGANVNMNFQAQAMGYQELTASSILPQGSTGTAPMMSRRMGRQFQNSAQGLTFGLHKGRHGGY